MLAVGGQLDPPRAANREVRGQPSWQAASQGIPWVVPEGALERTVPAVFCTTATDLGSAVPSGVSFRRRSTHGSPACGRVVDNRGAAGPKPPKFVDNRLAVGRRLGYRNSCPKGPLMMATQPVLAPAASQDGRFLRALLCSPRGDRPRLAAAPDPVSCRAARAGRTVGVRGRPGGVLGPSSRVRPRGRVPPLRTPRRRPSDRAERRGRRRPTPRPR